MLKTILDFLFGRSGRETTPSSDAMQPYAWLTPQEMADRRGLLLRDIHNAVMLLQWPKRLVEGSERRIEVGVPRDWMDQIWTPKRQKSHRKPAEEPVRVQRRRSKAASADQLHLSV